MPSPSAKESWCKPCTTDAASSTPRCACHDQSSALPDLYMPGDAGFLESVQEHFKRRWKSPRPKSPWWSPRETPRGFRRSEDRKGVRRHRPSQAVHGRDLRGESSREREGPRRGLARTVRLSRMACCDADPGGPTGRSMRPWRADRPWLTRRRIGAGRGQPPAAQLHHSPDD